jgi:hypothetical protein
MNLFDLSDIQGNKNPTPYPLYGDEYTPNELYYGIPTLEGKVSDASVIACSEFDDPTLSNSTCFKGSPKIHLIASVVPRRDREEFIGDLLERRRIRYKRWLPRLKKARRILAFTVNAWMVFHYCIQLVHYYFRIIHYHLEHIVQQFDWLIDWIDELIQHHDEF